MIFIFFNFNDNATKDKYIIIYIIDINIDNINY